MPRPFRRGGGGRGRPRPGGSRGRSNNRRGPFTPNSGDQGGNGVAVALRAVELPPIMTVEELATLLAMPPAAIISGLIKNGIFATMNQVIDYDTASSASSAVGTVCSWTSNPRSLATDDAAAEELSDEELAQLEA